MPLTAVTTVVAGPEQRREARDDGRHRMRLEGQDHVVLRAELGGVLDRGDRQGGARLRLDQRQAVRAHRGEVGAAGDQADVCAGLGELAPEVAPDRAGPEDADAHGRQPPFTKNY